VRGHWGIENNLHWQLDVTFQEDQCRIRTGHADANFSILRRTALSMLKNESTLKVGIKNKRLTAGWDETYLKHVLCAQ
jgi:predicted transposase YbfD/YdcC